MLSSSIYIHFLDLALDCANICLLSRNTVTEKPLFCYIVGEGGIWKLGEQTGTFSYLNLRNSPCVNDSPLHIIQTVPNSPFMNFMKSCIFCKMCIFNFQLIYIIVVLLCSIL